MQPTVWGLVMQQHERMVSNRATRSVESSRATTRMVSNRATSSVGSSRATSSVECNHATV